MLLSHSIPDSPRVKLSTPLTRPLPSGRAPVSRSTGRRTGVGDACDGGGRHLQCRGTTRGVHLGRTPRGSYKDHRNDSFLTDPVTKKYASRTPILRPSHGMRVDSASGRGGVPKDWDERGPEKTSDREGGCGGTFGRT